MKTRFTIWKLALAAISFLMVANASMANPDLSGKRQPHPPTTRPPQVSSYTAAQRTPPAYQPRPYSDSSLQTTPARKNPIASPEPASPIAHRANTESSPSISSMNHTSGKPTLQSHDLPKEQEPARVKLTGYIVFAAGALLLFRKPDED